MKRTMKSGLFWATAIVMSIGLSFSVMADDLRISTGASGGTYHNVFGVNLADIMREQGFQPETLTSKGSAENLDRIVNGEADVGFTQADALALWLTKHPGAGVEILGKLGQECVYLAVSDNGDVQDESDLDNAGASIAVGDQGSGSAMTWDYLRTLNEDYQSASTYYQGGIRALAKVKTGELDAFLWVTSPENLNHKFLQAVRTSGSGMHLVDVDDYGLNNKLPNGEQVYEFRDVELEDAMFADTVEVPCTSVLVVASRDLDDTALETVATAVMMNGNRVKGQ